jgi:hypothetical protein
VANLQGAEVTTRLRWHSRASKKLRAAAVEAARFAGYKRASDTGEALNIPHRRGDLGPVYIFLAGAGRAPKLFTEIE